MTPYWKRLTKIIFNHAYVLAMHNKYSYTKKILFEKILRAVSFSVKLGKWILRDLTRSQQIKWMDAV